jgi:hypothetical protein
MLWKALTLAAAALALWSLARRALGLPGGDGREPAPGSRVEDLARCAACGAWRARLEPCACETPPTP